LTPEQTAALVTRSHTENTTVHAALCTAFLRAFAEFYGNGWQRTIQSPINLRQRLKAPVGETFGLYINLAEFPVDCAPEHNFWEVARAIKQGFVQHSSDQVIFKDLVGTGTFVDTLASVMTPSILIQSVAQVKYDLSITNLGRLPFPTQYGSLQLDALFGPCISGKRNEVILSVNTVNNKMHLTLIFTDVKLTTAQAEEIKGKALKWLGEAVGW
jgi:hypothetical protein